MHFIGLKRLFLALKRALLKLDDDEMHRIGEKTGILSVS